MVCLRGGAEEVVGGVGRHVDDQWIDIGIG